MNKSTSKSPRFEPPRLKRDFRKAMEEAGVELPKKPNASTERWLRMANLLMLSQNDTKLKKVAAKSLQQWYQRNRQKAQKGLLSPLEEKILQTLDEMSNINKMESNETEPVQKPTLWQKIVQWYVSMTQDAKPLEAK